MSSFNIFDPSTYLASEQLTPFGYQTNPTPPLASQTLGLLNPLLAPLAQSLGLDSTLITQLLGSQLFSTSGSLTNPSNFSNIYLNRLDWNQGEAARIQRNNLKDTFIRQLVEKGMMATNAKNIATNLKGEITPEDVRQAIVASEMRKDMLSPYVLSAQYAASALGLEAMAYQFELGRGAFGGYARLGEKGIPIGYTDRVLSDYDLASERILQTFTAEGEGPGKWGGLKGRDIAKLYNYMAKDTGLFSNLKDATGKILESGTPQWAEAVSKEVKGMANIMGTLKELFNKEIPELLKDMEQTFGHNAVATYGQSVVDSLVKQMKHTARLSGVKPETIMQMATIAEGYSATLGVNRSGGGLLAANMAAQMIGVAAPGMSGEYVNQAQLKDMLLKKTVGAQQSGLAMAISGAYVLARRAGMTQEEFERRLAGMEGRVSMESLQQEFNLTYTDIAAAGRTTEARKYRDTSAAVTEAAMASGFARMRDQRAAVMKQYLLASGYSSEQISKIDFNGTAADIINTARQLLGDRAGDVLENVADVVAQQSGYENRQTLDLAEAKARQAVELRRQVERRAELDRRIAAELGIGTPGVAGLVAGLRKGGTIADFIKSTLGMTDKEEFIKAASSQELSNSIAKLQNEAEASNSISKKAEVTKQLNFLASIMDFTAKSETGQEITEADRLAVIKAATANNWEEVEKIRLRFSKEGVLKQVKQELSDLGLKEDATAAQIDTAMKVNALKAAGIDLQANLGIDPTAKIDFTNKDLSKKVDEFIEGALTALGDEGPLSKVANEYIKQKEILTAGGVLGSSGTMEDILKRLGDFLDQLLRDGVQAVVNIKNLAE